MDILSLFMGKRDKKYTFYDDTIWVCSVPSCRYSNSVSCAYCDKCSSPKGTIIEKSNSDDGITYKENIPRKNSVETKNIPIGDYQSRLCLICKSNDRTFAIIECRHLICCGTCIKTLKSCPVCNKTYNPKVGYIRTYSS